MLSNAIAQARALLQTEIAPKVPGFSISVARDGDLVWSEPFGKADLTAGVPVTPQTRFRIGSVSKPLTAAGLALLVEMGRLDLDAPIQKYLPDFPPKTGVITPRLLAGHLSGLRNYRGREGVSNRPFASLRSGLAIFENDPLEAPPGTEFSYASYNYNLLGAVMEAAAGQEFPSFIHAHVIQPLKLASTKVDRVGAPDPERAQFYETGPDGRFFTSPTVDLSYAWPSGGYLSTTDDMARFGAAHLKPGFLKADSLNMLFTPQKTNAGAPIPYGVGWFVGRDTHFHGGNSIGGAAILLLLPRASTVVAIATNGGQAVLQNALRREKCDNSARRFLFNKEDIANRIANVFHGS